MKTLFFSFLTDATYVVFYQVRLKGRRLNELNMSMHFLRCQYLSDKGKITDHFSNTSPLRAINNTGMVGHGGRKAKKIYIMGYDYALLLVGKGQMLFVGSLKFSCLSDGNDINPTPAHSFGNSSGNVLIKVKLDRGTQTFPCSFWSRSDGVPWRSSRAKALVSFMDWSICSRWEK